MADLSIGSCIRPLRFADGAAGDVILKRRTIAAIVKGVPHEGPVETSTIAGHIQQVGAKELMRLPEGDRTKDAIAVYTEFRLRTVDVRTGALADRISYNNYDYEVMKLEDWSSTGGYFRALCVKVGQ